jgi:hypothetical protein
MISLHKSYAYWCGVSIGALSALGAERLAEPIPPAWLAIIVFIVVPALGAWTFARKDPPPPSSRETEIG